MVPVWLAVAVASAGMHIKGMQGTCWSAEYHGAWLVIGSLALPVLKNLNSHQI